MLIAYLLLTFTLTWGVAAAFVVAPDALSAAFGPLRMTNPLFVLAVYGPAIAALIVVAWAGGLAGVRGLLGRLGRWRCGPGWYLLILVGFPAIMVLGAAAGGTLAAYTFDHGSIGAVLVALATAAAIGPVEELGWRGVMLPLLQRRVPPLAAAPILGAVWGIWHVPAFLLSGTPQSAWSFAPYFVSLLAVSVVMTAAFNASSGSLLVAALAHFQLNNPLVPDGQPFDAWLFVALGAAVAWFCRNGALARDAAATDVFGSDGSRAR